MVAVDEFGAIFGDLTTPIGTLAVHSSADPGRSLEDRRNITLVEQRQRRVQTGNAAAHNGDLRRRLRLGGKGTQALAESERSRGAESRSALKDVAAGRRIFTPDVLKFP